MGKSDSFAREEAGAVLADKPRLVAANKIDALDEPDRLARLRDYLAAEDVRVFPISAVTGEGVPALLEAMWKAVARAKTRQIAGEQA